MVGRGDPHFPDPASRASEGIDPGSRGVGAPAAPDDHPDKPMMLSIAPSAPSQVRCECETCGAHVLVAASWQLAGWCSNCGGYALRALEPAAPPPVAPLAALDVLRPAVVPLPQARAA